MVTRETSGNRFLLMRIIVSRIIRIRHAEYHEPCIISGTACLGVNFPRGNCPRNHDVCVLCIRIDIESHGNYLC